MAVMHTLQPTKLLALCKKKLPDCTFQAAESFYWSPHDKTVYFNEALLGKAAGQTALLHEASHAALRHTHYGSDAELLSLEVMAWQEAIEQAVRWSIDIDTEHVQDCLDTYRDWLYARSSCPACMVSSLQVSPLRYKCLNCLSVWSVSPSRFCRPYRMQSRGKKIPSSKSQTVFQ